MKTWEQKLAYFQFTVESSMSLHSFSDVQALLFP
jgi:hypothetical protein